MVSWKAVLPARGAALGSRPRPALLEVEGEGGARTLEVPVAVARALGSGPREAPSREAFEELLARTCYEAARARIDKLCSVRDRSVRELDERLGREGFDESTRASALGRSVEVGIVDDVRFAESFARGRAALGWGRRRIEDELRRRGVDADLIEGWPDEFLGGGEFERALEAARRRPPAKRANAASTLRFLAGRGFPRPVASAVARRLAEEERGC